MSEVEDPQINLPFFRKQATESALQRFGAPVRPLGIGMWSLTMFVVALIALSGGFLVTMSFPRKETASGALVPSLGLLPIMSLRSGTVSKVFVQEGDYVRAGDALVRVSVDSVTDANGSTGQALNRMNAILSEASASREQATIDALSIQESSIRESIREAESQWKLLNGSRSLYREQVEISEQTVHDIGLLRAERLVSELQYREAKINALDARQAEAAAEARLGELRQQINEHRHSLQRLSSERIATRSASLVERIGIQEKSLTQELGTEFDLVSPTDGRVTWLGAKPGAAVVAGHTLGSTMPKNSELLAELWVPSSAIAFVSVGTKVRLMYDAFPYQKFGVGHATIIRIAHSPTGPEELPVELQANEGHYRLLAKLDSGRVDAYGKSLEVAPGMRLKADLILEDRSLIDWILEPLLAARRWQA